MDKNELLEIQNAIFLFLENHLKEFVSNLLPKNEIKFLPPSFIQVHNMYVFYDYLFVLDKYLGCHILPQKYTPLYSTEIEKQLLHDSHLKKQVDRFVKYCTDGDGCINMPSYNFIPPSAKSYFKGPFAGKVNRYNNDYVYDSHRIRHAHLQSPNNDLLLFYVLVDSHILLLNIGQHNDIYGSKNLKTIIHDFPEYLDKLRIHEIKGISPGIEQNETEIKEMWKHHVSPLFNVDGKLYLATIMALNGSNMLLSGELQNILYQIDTGVKYFDKKLNYNSKIYLVKSKSKLSINRGAIVIGDRISKKECIVSVPYFNKLSQIEKILPYATKAMKEETNAVEKEG
jgi:hypothetical protein